MPQASCRKRSAPSSSTSSDGTQLTSTSRWWNSPAWCSASFTEMYASGRLAYLPTTATFSGALGSLIRPTISSQSPRSGCSSPSPSACASRPDSPASCSTSGTS